jgi:trk system potassium uptake protein TrkA
MKVVILGCGRVGARLATMMDSNGHDVSIIDSNPDSFRRLPESFQGETVLGTGIDVDVLKSAGIEHADAFAAVTNGDNTNIMATQIAKEIFGVDKVLARIYDPGREGLYHELGLETVCPTTLISTQVYDILSHDASTSPAEPAATAQPVAAAQAGTALATSASQQASPNGAQALTTPPPDDHGHKTQDGNRGLRGLFRP